MGTADLIPVTATARTVLIAIVGAAYSGKTTLLAAHWLSARRGSGKYGRRFAGSYTLLGWHHITRHLQWIPHGNGFPPHTTATNERAPSLLHVAVTDKRRGRSHILFTDVPGEWFTAWAFDEASAPGAEWIAEHADAFVLLADGEALAGPDRGRARGDHQALADRVATVAHRRPVVPVQTKADITVPATIRSHLDNLHERLFGASTVRVSVHDSEHDPITRPLDEAIALALAPRLAQPPPDEPRTADPFLAYRAPSWT